MSNYTLPPRENRTLLASTLPDWAKVVWLAVRHAQGGNDRAWESYEKYGRRCNKSESMVRKAVGLLRKEGWIETVGRRKDGRTRELRCTIPDGPDVLATENPGSGGTENEGSPATGNKGSHREQGSQSTENGGSGGTENPGSSAYMTPYRDSLQDSNPIQSNQRDASEGKSVGSPNLKGVPVPLWSGEARYRDHANSVWKSMHHSEHTADFLRSLHRTTIGSKVRHDGTVRATNPNAFDLTIHAGLIRSGWPRDWLCMAFVVAQAKDLPSSSVPTILANWLERINEPEQASPDAPLNAAVTGSGKRKRGAPETLDDLRQRRLLDEMAFDAALGPASGDSMPALPAYDINSNA